MLQFEAEMCSSCSDWIEVRRALICQMSIEPDLLPGRGCVADGSSSAGLYDRCGLTRCYISHASLEASLKR